MALYQTINFLKGARDFIQAKTYEPIVLQLMNQSKTVFPEEYFHVKEQSHGEADFCSTSKVKFDAKLLFSTEQCKYLARGDENLIDWMQSLRQELWQVSEMLLNRNLDEIHTTRLYKEMLQRLPDEDFIENTIYFTPYPIVPAFESSVYIQFASDIISITYNALVTKNPERFINKSNYIIYPTSDAKKMVLRILGEDKKEYTSIEPLLEHIRYVLINEPNLDADIIYYR
ncbi:MAG: hypothetical protein ACOX62_09335 [Christensenellales bacterium]